MALKQFFSRKHGILLTAGAVILGVGMLVSPDASQALFPQRQTIVIPTPQEQPRRAEHALPPAPVATSAQTTEEPVERYRIRRGDTLSAIFADRNLPSHTLHELLEADAEFLALETLHPGTELAFAFDEQEALKQLTVHIDPAREVVFERQADGSFHYRQIEAETYWSPIVLSGDIHRSFYQSGVNAGLNDRQVDELRRLLKRKIDFRRDIREGDTFSVLVSNEMARGQETGRYRIEAVTLASGGLTTRAFLYDDGNYYDENGESILPAFRRWPTASHYRVSSPFNPRRLHPVTGKVSPHNGVDLATPAGTSVMSTGDGVVARVGNHPYAGKYVDIRHNGSLSTRYLHLSRVLVKKGQRVSRGQEIARSGNTGRSTGPHLHFEFRIDGRPVNPLTADIPTATQVPPDELDAFEALVHKRLAMMHVPDSTARVHAQSTDPQNGRES